MEGYVLLCIGLHIALALDRVQLQILVAFFDKRIFVQDRIKGHANFLHHALGCQIFYHTGGLDVFKPEHAKAKGEHHAYCFGDIASAPVRFRDAISDLRPCIGGIPFGETTETYQSPCSLIYYSPWRRLHAPIALDDASCEERPAFSK